MNKNVIFAIAVIIIIAIVGFHLFSQPEANTHDGKLNTQIRFLSPPELKNGDQVQFVLKDATGAPLAGKNVTISYDYGSGNVQKYSINTDQNGKGYLTISGEEAGNYDIRVDFHGTTKYNRCNAKQTITIEDGTSDAEETVSENSTANTVMYNNNTGTNGSSESSNTYYDAELNVHYNENGEVIGGQDPGASIYELRERYDSQDMIDEDGNLQ